MPSETTSSPPTSQQMLALLCLPVPAHLTPPQIRGADCVWCGMQLHGDTAVDLGQRYNSIVGVVGRWFPQGCRPCTLKPLLALYYDHCRCCEQCVDDASLCETRRTLRKLALELRR